MTVPKVRRDGRCLTCKGERKFNPQRGVPFGAYWNDPFCSSACARKFYGTELKHHNPVGPPKKHRGVDPPRSRSKTNYPKYA